MGEKKPYVLRARQTTLLLIILLLLSLLSIFFCVAIGSSSMTFSQAMKALWQKIAGLPIDEESHVLILFGLRLPRVLLSYLVGAALGICGAAMQGVFQNPMADPHLLGVSSGAAFGATLGLLFGVGATLMGFGVITLFAFAGGLCAVLLVHMLASVGGRTSPMRLLLAGLAMTSLLSASISGLMVYHREQIEYIVQWTMGSFTRATWNKVNLCLIVVLPVSVLLLPFSRTLNALSLGDEEAMSLGISVQGARRSILLLSTLATAAAVSVSGIIGFVGLVVPHGVRMVLGSDHRSLLPVSFFVGGIFLTLMDTLARTIAAPLELPVGVLTSIIGGVFFLWLMRKGKK